MQLNLISDVDKRVTRRFGDNRRGIFDDEESAGNLLLTDELPGACDLCCFGACEKVEGNVLYLKERTDASTRGG